MDRLPVDLTAEFRGVRAATTFTRRDTGQVIDVPAKLKFELADESGDVSLLEVSMSQLDKVAGFDGAKLTKGDRVHLRGWVIIQDRGSDRDSYVAWDQAAVLDAKATPVRAAS